LFAEEKVKMFLSSLAGWEFIFLILMAAEIRLST